MNRPGSSRHGQKGPRPLPPARMAQISSGVAWAAIQARTRSIVASFGEAPRRRRSSKGMSEWKPGVVMIAKIGQKYMLIKHYR